MPETVLGRIIASVLLLLDAIVAKFIAAPTWASGNLDNCTPAGYSGGALTVCGAALVDGLAFGDIMEALAETWTHAIIALPA
jgi:hypothetical protein